LRVFSKIKSNKEGVCIIMSYLRIYKIRTFNNC
jgi:hypothetical protein